MKKAYFQIYNTRFLTAVIGILFGAFAQAQVGLPNLSANDKYTVLTVIPNKLGMTSGQINLVNQVEMKTQSLTGKISSIAAQAFSMDKGISKIFVNLGEALKAELGPQLNELKASLPTDEAINLSVYVLPWEDLHQVQSQNSVLTMIGSVQEAHIDLTSLALMGKNKAADLYAKINTKIRKLKVSDTVQFQLQSIAFHIKLLRGQSQIRVQLLGQLRKMSTPFIKDNEQVHIRTLEILGDENLKQSPMALLNLTQPLQGETLELPELTLEFGQFGGVSGGFNGWAGSYQILSNPWAQNDCQDKLNSTPSLTGTIAKNVAGNSQLGKALGVFAEGTPIKFRILNLEIDAASLKISKMSLAMEVGMRQFPQCLTAESVNVKFQAEANLAIETQLSQLYKQDDMTDDLMSALYN